MARYNTSNKTNLILGVVILLVIVLIVGMVMLFVRMDEQSTSNNITYSDYKIGALNEEGKYIKDTSCIVLDDAITVDGLSIKLVKDADIQYQLVFYTIDEDGKTEFVSMTEFTAEDLTADMIPETADVVRIVIDPLYDAEVSALEIKEYAKQLMVTHNK